jgi:hypothetical protein
MTTLLLWLRFVLLIPLLAAAGFFVWSAATNRE